MQADFGIACNLVAESHATLQRNQVQVCSGKHSGRSAEIGRLRKQSIQLTSENLANSELSISDISSRFRNPSIKDSVSGMNRVVVALPARDGHEELVSKRQELLSILLLRFDDGPSSSDSALWSCKGA